MKNVVIAIGFVCLITPACTSSESSSNDPAKDPVNIEKAHQLIKAEIQESLGKKAGSYQAISFGSLDSSYDNLDPGADPNKAYPQKYAGYKMSHDFKALDISDSLRAEHITYFFNDSITKIIAIRDSIPVHKN